MKNLITRTVNWMERPSFALRSCEQYEERLEKSKDALARVTLHDLYKDKSIVGNVMDNDYEPVLMSSGMARAKRALSLWTSDSKKSTDQSGDVEENTETSMTETE